MGKTKGAGENSRKAAGNARKAEQANKKKQEEDAKVAALEDEEWSQGAKGKAKKKEEEAAKKAEAARKKAERDAMLKEEEASLPTKPLRAKNRGAEKIAARRTGKIDDFLNFNDAPEVSASGIDNVLEALSLTNQNGAVQDKDIDRHPERRVKAAYLAFEERRIPEIRAEHPGLRLQQVKNLIHKEFEKAPENPMNQLTNIHYNATRDEVGSLKKEVTSTKEKKFSA